MTGIITRGKLTRADLAQWDGKTATHSRVDATGGTVTGLAVGNEVDVLQVFGSGTSRTRGTIGTAVQHIGSTGVTLVFAPGAWTIDSSLTIPSNFTCHVSRGCIFTVDSGQTLTFSGPVYAESSTFYSGSGTTVLSVDSIVGGKLWIARTAAEIAAGVTPTDYAYDAGILERYGAVADDSTNCATAIAAAIAQSRQAGGAIVRPWVADGVYRTLSPVVLYEGVRADGLVAQGAAGLGASIRYMGGDFVDVVTTASSSEDDSIQFTNWRVLGGAFQAGTARYGFYAEAFHRGCVLTGCIFRDCYGPIKIVSGYYSAVHHNIFGLVTPSQVAGGASDAEFLEVYATSSAPAYFGEMNGCDVSHNTFQALVSQHNSGAQAINAIYVSGQNVNCRGWVVESTGIDYSGYTPRVDNMIRNDGYADFSGIYVEHVDVVNYMILGFREAITNIVGFSMLNCAGTSIFRNQAIGDMTVDKGVGYQMDFSTAWSLSATTPGAGGDINLGPDVRIFSGSRVTDAAVNADGDNVYDTADSTNTLGCADGSFIRTQRQKVCFPRVVTGLAVTDSSDGDGDYIQVTSGVLLSERGGYVNAKWRTGNTASGLMAVQRLRVAASKFYRVVVGRAGNIHLSEAGSAFTDPSGDWLSEFSTNGSAQIGSLTANPRLSLRGNYITGTSVCSGHRQTFGAADTTPSVANGDYFVTGGAVTFTAFDDPEFVGHEIFVEFAHACTVDFTGTTLNGNAASDFSAAVGDAMRCKWNGTNWLCDVIDATA